MAELVNWYRLMASQSEAYRRQLEGNARRSRERSKSGRDIGKIPKVKDKGRKAAGADSLEEFCRLYLPAWFGMPFCAAHRAAMERLQACSTDGGLFALAMMRGGGKTTLARAEVLRAILYGLRRFVVLIQATQPLAVRSLKVFRRELEANDLLDEDFPEVCYPIRKLDRIHHRALGQTLGGKPTRMEWTADGLVLPTVKGSKASGAVLHVAGLTGAIKGLNVSGPDGQLLRPDMVLLDDCQTRDSAKSPTQTADRESIITDDVLGLAGPDTTIAAVNLCTPIYPGDLSERFIDREKHPEWGGVRTRMLESVPSDMGSWDRWDEIRRENGRDKAREFYLGNRPLMDAGAVATWPERLKAGPYEGASAVELAMTLYYANPRGFKAEYQCEPEVESLGSGLKELRAEDVANRDRLTGLDALTVPAEATRLTAGFDVGGELCWYCVVAWDERFTGWVVDYGCWPRQSRTMFAALDARPGLSDSYPRLNESQRVLAGLRDIAGHVLSRPYRRSSGGELRVERALADRGWQPDAVQQVVRLYPGTLLPSVGIGRTTNRTGVSEWKRRPGERSGYHWRLTVGEDRRRMVQFDPDSWKTFLWERFTTASGGAGALMLPGRTVNAHALLGEHCAAEYGEPTTIRGVTFDKWTIRPSRPDNHLWDVLVLACVAASVAGIRWEPSSAPTSPPPQRSTRPAVDFAELVRRNRAVKGGV